MVEESVFLATESAPQPYHSYLYKEIREDKIGDIPLTDRRISLGLDGEDQGNDSVSKALAMGT